MRAATRRDFPVISTAEELQSGSWPFGTVVQELHTGDCCDDEHFCDLNPPMWELTFQGGWARTGARYAPEDQRALTPGSGHGICGYAASGSVAGARVLS